MRAATEAAFQKIEEGVPAGTGEVVPADAGKVVPAGPGKVTPAGRGKRHFRTLDVTDGLAGSSITSQLQDRDGNLWFATWRSGVCRFDGHRFTTFTQAAGLAHDRVYSIAEDQQGHIWFGTMDGVSRYDVREVLPPTRRGKRFTTFTEADGLADNNVYSIVEDTEGHLWFGTAGGVSQYHRNTFTTFTTKDGLGSHLVWRIAADKQANLWFGTDGGVSRYNEQTGF